MVKCILFQLPSGEGILGGISGHYIVESGGGALGSEVDGEAGGEGEVGEAVVDGEQEFGGVAIWELGHELEADDGYEVGEVAGPGGKHGLEVVSYGSAGLVTGGRLIRLVVLKSQTSSIVEILDEVADFCSPNGVEDSGEAPDGGRGACGKEANKYKCCLGGVLHH